MAGVSSRRPRRRQTLPAALVVVLDLLAERTARGMLCRAAGAWLLVGLPVVAARLWWTVPAALIAFAVTLSTYVTLTVRHMHRQSARDGVGRPVVGEQ